MSFCFIHGGNGAEFFFSVRSFNDWKHSLNFYRGVSWRAKLKKIVLTAAFSVIRENCSGVQVAEKIKDTLHLPIAPELPEHGSAMISPTRDKAVIHHHGRGYEKWAADGSLAGVKNELAVYQRLLQKPPRQFACSSLGEFELQEAYIRFFMNYAEGTFSEAVPALESLLPSLAEFFSYGDLQERPWAELLAELKVNELVPVKVFEGTTPVGLVHRDFKPWNVKSGKKPLFFDFEAASFAGCPLEDFFNYTIDPMIRIQSEQKVFEQIKVLFPLGIKLLLMMKTDHAKIKTYWYWYLLERVSFWRKQAQFELAEKYKQLLIVSRNEL